MTRWSDGPGAATMGAIAVHLPADGPPDPRAVERMLRASPHRGTRFERVIQGRCALGISHREDLDDTSLFREDGMASAFIGTLDNAAQLVGDLDPKDGAREASPAQVVLRLIRTGGLEGLSRLRGVFAAAVTDGSEVWCFRDHLAFGQLFYRHDARGFFAATEAKQVVAGAGIPYEPDLQVVEDTFYANVDDDTPCALNGVARLPKSSVLVSDGERTRRRRYWNPESLIESARPSIDEVAARFHELMAQATARVLTGSDVLSLSGGVDSPALAAFAAPIHVEMTGRPLGALSMVFPDFPSVDESAYIRLVAERLPIDLHTFQPQAHPLDNIEYWVRICDGPIPVTPPAEAEEFYLKARSLGYNNLLSGDFAEFLIDRKYGILSHLLWQRRIKELWTQLGYRRAKGFSWPSIARPLVSTFVPRQLLLLRLRNRALPDDSGFPDWLDPSFVKVPEARFFLHPRELWRKEQMAFFTGPGIGMEADEICSAVSGVRIRRPWIDIDLAEFFLSLPAEMKFPDHQRKTLARKLLRGKVPDEILDRSDKTFFNDFLLARIDYPAFRKWLINPTHRIRGVSYERLQERLDREDFQLGDYKWAVDLAKTHAFLSLW